MLVESASADLLQPVTLRPPMRDQFRPCGGGTQVRLRAPFRCCGVCVCFGTKRTLPLRLWYCSARRPAPNMWRFAQPKSDMDDLGLAFDAKRQSTLLEHFQHRHVIRQDLGDQFLESGFPGDRGEMMHEGRAE